MTVPMGIAIYFTIWWIVLFAVLPFGVRSQHEGVDYAAGTDPGAPIKPHILLKAAATTVVSAVLFSMLWVYMEHFG